MCFDVVVAVVVGGLECLRSADGGKYNLGWKDGLNVNHGWKDDLNVNHGWKQSAVSLEPGRKETPVSLE